MTNPVYKIETWTGGVKDYTIEKDVTNLQFKEVLTYGVGTFSFTVPTVKGVPDPYYFSDIATDDIVKIWLDYDSVSGDPDFVGKVTKPNGRLSTAEGYVRQISGLSQGEVLLRKFKRDTLWSAVGASTIVEELCDDLGLGKTEVEADATSETMEVTTERYIDVLKRVSDYYDVGGSVKKDFYVDVDNNLVWASRDGTAPFRTTPNVEALTIGENILSYNIVRDVTPVKNNIAVYGAKYDTPSNHDDWTDATAGWTSNGALTADPTNQKRGTYSVKTTGANVEPLWMQRTFASIKCAWKNHRFLNFYFYLTDSSGLDYGGTYTVYLLAPDASNRFRHGVNNPGLNSWLHYRQELGPQNASWVVDVGDPDWNDIQGFQLATTDNCVGACVAETINIDELYFSDQHYTGTASSGAADRDLEVNDPRFLSDADCARLAETWLYQKSSQPIQINLVIIGNPNVLVGDRIPMTIPSEEISAQDYDVISVEQLGPLPFITTVTMLNSENIREPLQTNVLETLINTQQTVKALSRDQKIVS